MNDGQLLRYSRHILLEEIGITGQQRLVDGSALVVGAGGLGSPAALYLASAGVGRLTVADGDKVDLTNLQRQILHTDQRVGQPKAQSARIALHGVNPEVRVREVASRVAGDELAVLVADADVVLDCSDNFATRHAVNRACVERRKPLVSGAAIGFAGQLAVFDSRRADAPCYHCLFPEGEDVEEMRCALMGVFAPLTGIIGSMQAAEAIKLLVGCGTVSEGRLWLLDGLAMEWRSVRFARDPHCPVCATGPGN